MFKTSKEAERRTLLFDLIRAIHLIFPNPQPNLPPYPPPRSTSAGQWVDVRFKQSTLRPSGCLLTRSLQLRLSWTSRYLSCRRVWVRTRR
ncbi:hypothetical protein GBA52_024486 [Prunus armeniaca]|nr:hypothetical protein GBA52_024486 [Prunus armeniaca]